MNKKQQLQQLIHQYKTKDYKYEAFRLRLRNKIYGLMRDKMVNWIKGRFKKWGIYREEDEILSLSWDAFLFCLEKYDEEKNYDLYRYFNDFVRYFLLLHRAEEKDKLEPEYMEDLKGLFTEDLFIKGDYEASDILTRLKNFRDLLPDKYRKIFDNTLLGVHPKLASGSSSVSKENRGELSYYKYYGLKEAFKIVIRSLVDEEKREVK